MNQRPSLKKMLLDIPVNLINKSLKQEMFNNSTYIVLLLKLGCSVKFLYNSLQDNKDFAQFKATERSFQNYVSLIKKESWIDKKFNDLTNKQRKTMHKDIDSIKDSTIRSKLSEWFQYKQKPNSINIPTTCPPMEKKLIECLMESLS